MITLGATPLFNVTAGTGPIGLYDVYCVGIELRLMDCALGSLGWRVCDHSDDVGVRCLAASPGPGVFVFVGMPNIVLFNYSTYNHFV